MSSTDGLTTSLARTLPRSLASSRGTRIMSVDRSVGETCIIPNLSACLSHSKNCLTDLLTIAFTVILLCFATACRCSSSSLSKRTVRVALKPIWRIQPQNILITLLRVRLCFISINPPTCSSGNHSLCPLGFQRKSHERREKRHPGQPTSLRSHVRGVWEEGESADPGGRGEAQEPVLRRSPYATCVPMQQL